MRAGPMKTWKPGEQRSLDNGLGTNGSVSFRPKEAAGLPVSLAANRTIIEGHVWLSSRSEQRACDKSMRWKNVPGRINRLKKRSILVY